MHLDHADVADQTKPFRRATPVPPHNVSRSRSSRCFGLKPTAVLTVPALTLPVQKSILTSSRTRPSSDLINSSYLDVCTWRISPPRRPAGTSEFREKQNPESLFTNAEREMAHRYREKNEKRVSGQSGSEEMDRGRVRGVRRG